MQFDDTNHLQKLFFFTDNQVKFYQLKIRDDEDVHIIFLSHEHFEFNDIELYILQQQNQLSQIVDLPQVFVKLTMTNKPKSMLVNDDTVEYEQEPLLVGHVYCPPQHMTSLNLGADEPSSEIFHNPYMQTQGSLKVGDKFRTKEDRVRAIKKYHMELLVDYRVDRTNVMRYKILSRNEHCMFRLSVSYGKRSDSWDICYMGPTHTCIITNPVQDHRKLNSQLICDEFVYHQ